MSLSDPFKDLQPATAGSDVSHGSCDGLIDAATTATVLAGYH